MMDEKTLRKVREKLDKALAADRVEDAIPLLTQLVAAEPTSTRWAHKRGDLLRRVGRKAEAIASYEQAVDLYASQGFIARAVAMAKTVLSLDPSRIDVLQRVDPQAAQQLHRQVRPGSGPLHGVTGQGGQSQDARSGSSPGAAPAHKHPMVLDDDASDAAPRASTPGAARPTQHGAARATGKHAMVLDDDVPPARATGKTQTMSGDAARALEARSTGKHAMVLDDAAPPARATGKTATMAGEAARATGKHAMVLEDDAPPARATGKHAMVLEDDAPPARVTGKSGTLSNEAARALEAARRRPTRQGEEPARGAPAARARGAAKADLTQPLELDEEAEVVAPGGAYTQPIILDEESDVAAPGGAYTQPIVLDEESDVPSRGGGYKQPISLDDAPAPGGAYTQPIVLDEDSTSIEVGASDDDADAIIVDDDGDGSDDLSAALAEAEALATKSAPRGAAAARGAPAAAATQKAAAPAAKPAAAPAPAGKTAAVATPAGKAVAAAPAAKLPAAAPAAKAPVAAPAPAAGGRPRGAPPPPPPPPQALAKPALTLDRVSLPPRSSSEPLAAAASAGESASAPQPAPPGAAGSAGGSASLPHPAPASSANVGGSASAPHPAPPAAAASAGSSAAAGPAAGAAPAAQPAGGLGSRATAVASTAAAGAAAKGAFGGGAAAKPAAAVAAKGAASAFGGAAAKPAGTAAGAGPAPAGAAAPKAAAGVAAPKAAEVAKSATGVAAAKSALGAAAVKPALGAAAAKPAATGGAAAKAGLPPAAAAAKPAAISGSGSSANAQASTGSAPSAANPARISQPGARGATSDDSAPLWADASPAGEGAQDPSRPHIRPQRTATAQGGGGATRIRPYEPPPEEAELFSRALEAAVELTVAPDVKPNETRFSNAPPSPALELSAAEVTPRAQAATDEAYDAVPHQVEELGSLPLFPLFAEMPKDVLAEMVADTDLLELRDGDYVMRQGDPGDALFGIVEGSVVVEVPGYQKVQLTLSEGDVFGESCLLQDEPRHADVRVVGRLSVLRIPRDVLARALGHYPRLAELLLELLTRRLLGNLLQTSPLFQEFDAAGRRELSRMFEVRRAPAGTQLAITGKLMDGLYILLTGTLSVISPDDEEQIAAPGSMFGQHTLLSQEPSPHTVTARVNLVVLRLPAAAFAQVAMQYPTVVARLAELSASGVVSVGL